MNKNQIITFGDRIFARVVRNGKTILDFMTENVSNMSELISELRKTIQDFHGMVKIYIRNYHQGWGQEKWMII